jgi:hypothetical protein
MKSKTTSCSNGHISALQVELCCLAPPSSLATCPQARFHPMYLPPALLHGLMDSQR